MNDLAALQALLAPLFPGLMGVTLVEVARARVVATTVVRPELCTTGGIQHGGALMAFADTLGAHVNLPEGARTTTIDSSTKFISGASVGTMITGESTPYHRGRTTMVWHTVIRSETGKPCGGVTQTQLVLMPR